MSENPAASVADYLATREEVRTRMFVEGAGFAQPIADNGTAQGRAFNRRVELYILPSTT